MGDGSNRSTDEPMCFTPSKHFGPGQTSRRCPAAHDSPSTTALFDRYPQNYGPIRYLPPRVSVGDG
jgi:hypothetical protein